MEGGIRTSQGAGPAGSATSAEATQARSAGSQGAASARLSRAQTSQVHQSGKGKERKSAVGRKSQKYAAISSVKQFAGQAAALTELDDEANKLGDLSGAAAFDSQEGLTGEERLQRVTSKPGMAGLLKFTQHGSTKDIRKVGVNPQILQRVIIEDEWQLMSCMQLPTTIFFFIMFMLFFQQHYGTSYIHLQESNLRANFGESAWEVDDIDGIYDWFKGDLLGYAYSTDRGLGETSPGDDPWTSDLGGAEYQTWVAGILVRTQRAEIKPCDSSYVKDFNCSYMPSGSGLGTVDKQGKPQQQMPDAGVFVGGWERTERRRLQAIAESDGKYSPQNTTWVEDFYGPHRKYQPTTNMEWIAYKLSNWFPKRKTFKRAGKWITPKGAKQTDTPMEQAPKEAESPKVVAHKRAAEKEFQQWEARARSKSSKKKKKQKKSKKLHPKKKYRRKKTEGLYPHRRLDDVVARKPKSSKKVKAIEAEISHDGSAEPRELRQTRTEFSLGGWIPYPYVTTDVWEYIMPMSMSRDEADNLLDTWKEGTVIDRGTLFFGCEILFRNPHINNGLLTHSFINFVFSRGGHIYVEVTMQTLILETNVSIWVFAMVWMLTLVVNSISTPARLCAAWKRGGMASVSAHLKRFWNLLEWFLIFCGWLIVVAFLAERYGMWKFGKHYDDYLEGRAPLYLGGAAKHEELLQYDRNWFEEIHYNIMQTGNVDVWLQVVVAHYHNFLIWRFFIASRGQPRLAMYLKTIFDAGTDLVHLAVVIGIIFIAYVVSGHILFGRRMESFSTLEGALAYCIQIVLQKEFDYQTLTMQDFWTVSIWVWSFVILIVLVLVNIVLAMIFDTYADVRNNLNDSDTMFYTLQTIYKQVKLYSVWVSNRDLIMAVKNLQGDQVTAGKLREQVPGISNVQVQHLFDAAKIKLETLMTKGNKNALPEAVASVLIGVDQLKAGVKVMAGEERPREIGLDSADMGDFAGGKDDIPDSARLSATTGEIPSEGPLWLRQGLLPHLRRQEKFMDQVHAEIQGIDQKIKSKGVGAGLPDSPFEAVGLPWEDSSTVDEPDLKMPVVESGSRRFNSVASAPPDGIVSGAGKLGRAIGDGMWC